MSFTWIPLYEDLATRLLDYEGRQGELLDQLRTIDAAGLPCVRLVDEDGTTPLTGIDPFTFFATFNRGITDDNRKDILTRIRGFLGSTTPLPADFDGIPVADKRQSWFFPWAKDRTPDDLAALWTLARQAVTGGRDAVQPAVFDRCLKIKSVKIAKLTMGLFWVRPRAFLPLDGRSQPYLRRKGVAVPSTVSDWTTYRAVVDGTVSSLGSDFPALSRAAYHEPVTGRRYWAGGHQFGEESKLDEFKEQRTWYIGWAKTDTTKGARAAWKRIVEVKPGDLFAIKGLGGQNYTLQVHAVGQIDEVDAEGGRLTWSPVDVPLFHGRAPAKPGAGTWFETLCEVTTPEALAAVFGVGQKVTGPSGGGSTSGKGKVDPPVGPRPPHPLNLILHGPPGTGKTWRMRRMRKDFELPTPADEPPTALPPVDVSELTWFEVVALALHELKAAEAHEVVAHPLVQAKYVERAPQSKLSPYVWQQLQSHTVKSSTTVKYAQRSGLLVFDRKEDGRWFLPNGLPEELLAKAGQAEPARAAGAPDNQFLVTFHPSFTYEEFVEGIRPESGDGEEPGVRYPLRAGVFKRACERAVQLAGFTGGLAAFCELPVAERAELLAKAAPAVLFIDEINRGNVARILGELITLIEPDKRLGASEELIVTLPGSQARFGVPSNLWIVGTMNTADRSVVALDVALRRRFSFRECPPAPEELDGVEVEGVDLGKLLGAINDRLLVLRDRDHLIGHAFLWPMKADPTKRTLDELRRVFAESILPLLLEYFHDDLGRVGLVLGKAFVSLRAGATTFADFDHDQREDLSDRRAWLLADPMNLPAEAYRKIYA